MWVSSRQPWGAETVAVAISLVPPSSAPLTRIPAAQQPTTQNTAPSLDKQPPRHGLAFGYYSSWLVRLFMALTSPVSSGSSPPLLLVFSAGLVVCSAPAAGLASRSRTGLLFCQRVHGADLPGEQRPQPSPLSWLLRLPCCAARQRCACSARPLAACSWR